jgi:hypothetical protein
MRESEMDMRKLVLMVSLGAALAGCKSQPDVSLTNASPEEVAAKAKAAGISSQLQPGEWETKVALVDIDVPGINPAMKAEMLKRARETKVHSYCVTEEEAKRPGGIFAGEDDSKCTYSKFEMGGGKLDMTMVCPGEGGSMTMHVAGTFGADAVTATSEMQGAGKFPMRMKANVSSRRTGDCKSTPAPK